MPKKDKEDPSKKKKCPTSIQTMVRDNDEITFAPIGGGKLRYKDQHGAKVADVDIDDVLDPGSDMYKHFKNYQGN